MKWLLASLVAMLGVLVVAPDSAATPAYAYDAVAYAYDAPALPSSQSATTTYVRGSPAGPAVGSWASPAFARDDVVAANTAGDAIPAIKPGSSGGPTAGQRFPGSVREEVLQDNPSTCVYCRMETDSPKSIM